MTEGEFQLLRQTLLIFFQEMHVRVSPLLFLALVHEIKSPLLLNHHRVYSLIQVSLFLKNQVQKPNGHFFLSTSGPVPHGGNVPGLIRFVCCLHVIKNTSIFSVCHHLPPLSAGHLTVRGKKSDEESSPRGEVTAAPEEKDPLDCTETESSNWA